MKFEKQIKKAGHEKHEGFTKNTKSENRDRKES